jgi:hypothetical protein
MTHPLMDSAFGVVSPSSTPDALGRRYAALLACSHNHGFVDAPRLQVLLCEPDVRLRRGLIALAIEDTLGHLDRRWHERLEQQTFGAAQPVDYNPAVGLALDIAHNGLPAEALHRVSVALLREPACVVAKAQVLQQIEALEAAWIELCPTACAPTRFLGNAIDLVARTQRRIETACRAADTDDTDDSPDFWPAVTPGVRRECQQILSAFANRLCAALRAEHSL